MLDGARRNEKELAHEELALAKSNPVLDPLWQDSKIGKGTVNKR